MLTLFVVTCAVISGFWALVIFGYALSEGSLGFLFASPMDHPPTPREKRRESARLRSDLTTAQVELVVDTGPRQDIEVGIAKNASARVRDNENEKRGDLWLCDGRPIILALIQFVLVIPVCAGIVGLLGDSLTVVVWTVLSVFTVVTAVIIWKGWRIVPEKMRLGVKFGGEQRLGFLGPGFQFLIPYLETDEEVPLMTLVWGPQDQENLAAEFHIPGTAPDQNPEPGIFEIVFLGQWTITIVVQITLRFRRANKWAWYMALNEFVSVTDIGQKIAAEVLAVLNAKASEIERSHAYKNVSSAEEFLERWTEDRNQLPEMSAEILQRLAVLTNGQLGGVMIEGIVLIVGKPEEGLRKILQSLDEALANKFREELEGEGARLRLEKQFAAIRDLSPAAAARSLRLNELEVRRDYAQAAGKTSVLDSLAAVLTANQASQGSENDLTSETTTGT